MKTTYYKYHLPILIIMFLAHSGWAQEKVSKKIDKVYSLTNAGELHLENKYGNVIINGWEKKTVQIIIDIQVTKKKKDDAKELLSRIIPTINTAQDFVSVSSTIEEKSNSIFSKLFDKANPFDFDKSNIQIDYTIYLPFNAEINITNKFGDIIISGWNGKLKANLQHGDMWVNKDVNNANIEMKFGKLKTKSITYGNIQFKNGEIEIKNSKDLRIHSSGTIIAINNVENLEISSSKDQISIEETGTIRGELMFSKINISNLYENMNLTLEVADLWVSNIKKINANISIDQESSELNINIAGIAIDFNASLEQGLLRIPRSFTNVKTDMIDKRKRIRNISATYGNGSVRGKFKINGKKGIIVLKE